MSLSGGCLFVVVHAVSCPAATMLPASGHKTFVYGWRLTSGLFSGSLVSVFLVILLCCCFWSGFCGLLIRDANLLFLSGYFSCLGPFLSAVGISHFTAMPFHIVKFHLVTILRLAVHPVPRSLRVLFCPRD